MTLPAKKITHPYITFDDKIRNGEAIIDGTGIRVIDIAMRYEIMGIMPEEILVAYPHLTLSQVYDALSYYHENKNYFDKQIKDTINLVESEKRSYSSILEKKIGKVKNIYR